MPCIVHGIIFQMFDEIFQMFDEEFQKLHQTFYNLDETLLKLQMIFAFPGKGNAKISAKIQHFIKTMADAV